MSHFLELSAAESKVIMNNPGIFRLPFQCISISLTILTWKKLCVLLNSVQKFIEFKVGCF